MITESNKALLQRYLQEDVDENLLNYVATNTSGHSILYMSLEQFCTKAGIDEEQAFAFFKAFGVNSFLAFKRILRDCLYCENTEWGVTSRSISSIADDVLRYEIQNLTELAATLDCTMVHRLAQDIQKAGEVIAFGRGATEPYAHNLTRMLRQLGIRAVQPSNRDLEDTTYLSTLDSSALVIVFGFPRYSKDAILRLKLLKQQSVRIVSITDSHDSPYAFLSEYSFVMPMRSFDFTDAYAAGMAFINILSITLAVLNRERTLNRLQNRDAMIDEMNMFF